MLIRRNSSFIGTPGPFISNSADAQPLQVLVPAKINLTLEVLGKRPDGYHDIESLIVAVELFDEIVLAPDPSGSLTLTCDVPDLSLDDNLVLKAARLLKERTGCLRGAKIELVKKIPWAAGLGGGSSDAAGTLVGLNELWELGLPKERLAEFGAELGSDVPFFLHTPAAFCTKRGEVVNEVAVARAFDIVLVKPPMGLNTAAVYREFAANRGVELPRDSHDAIEALRRGDVEMLARSLHNRLQEPAMRLCPPVAELYRRLQATVAAGSLMSGSGSCLFALCRDQREAEQVIDDLRRGWLSEDETANPRIFHVKSCIGA